MRSRVSKEVFDEFRRLLEQELAQFKPLDKENSAGHPAWKWEFASRLNFFIRLYISSKYDEFTIQIGWSDEEKFPWDYDSAFFKNRLGEQKGSGALPWLWTTTQTDTAWEIVPRLSDTELERRLSSAEYVPLHYPDPPIENILPKVRPIVREAFDKLREYGFIFFRQIAEQRGITWPIV